MRCVACDAGLTDFDATIKCVNSGRFLDLCGRCRTFVAPVVDTTEQYELYDPDVDILDYDPVTETWSDGPSVLTSDGDGEDGEV